MIASYGGNFKFTDGNFTAKMPRPCHSCSVICNACAEECESDSKELDYCKRCAEVCRVCAGECFKMMEQLHS